MFYLFINFLLTFVDICICDVHVPNLQLNYKLVHDSPNLGISICCIIVDSGASLY